MEKDPPGVSEQPTSLPEERRYRIQGQSWDTTVIPDGTTSTPPLAPQAEKDIAMAQLIEAAKRKGKRFKKRPAVDKELQPNLI